MFLVVKIGVSITKYNFSIFLVVFDRQLTVKPILKVRISTFVLCDFLSWISQNVDQFGSLLFIQMTENSFAREWI